MNRKTFEERAFVLEEEELETVSGASLRFHHRFRLAFGGPVTQLAPGQTISFGTPENGGSVSVASSGPGVVRIASWHHTSIA